MNNTASDDLCQLVLAGYLDCSTVALTPLTGERYRYERIQYLWPGGFRSDAYVVLPESAVQSYFEQVVGQDWLPDLPNEILARWAGGGRTHIGEELIGIIKVKLESKDAAAVLRCLLGDHLSSLCAELQLEKGRAYYLYCDEEVVWEFKGEQYYIYISRQTNTKGK